MTRSPKFLFFAQALLAAVLFGASAPYNTSMIICQIFITGTVMTIYNLDNLKIV